MKKMMFCWLVMLALVLPCMLLTVAAEEQIEFVGAVGYVSTAPGSERIRIGNTVYQNNVTQDEIVEYDGITEGDVVVVKRNEDVFYLERPQVVTGLVTKISTRNGIGYTYIDDKEYVNSTFTVVEKYDLLAPDSLWPDATNVYECYIYNDKLIGAKLVPESSAVTVYDAVYVAANYSVISSDAYGQAYNSYYAQGVNAYGEEVDILIGIDDVGESLPVVTTLTPGFYLFHLSTDHEQASYGIMRAKAAPDRAAFESAAKEDYLYFFADAVSASELVLDSNTTALTGISGGKLQITADTKFIIIDSNTLGKELDIIKRSGYINKRLAVGDIVGVAAEEDVLGNYVAHTVVIITPDTSLPAEGHLYICEPYDYARVEYGYEYVVYFTETNEFRTIIIDSVIDTAGFYDGYTIDEDGVYSLGDVSPNSELVKNKQRAMSVSQNAIRSTDIDLCELADDAVVLDVRPEEVLEEAEVAEIVSFQDIQITLRNGYPVYFNALLELQDGEYVVTHIFIYEVTEPAGSHTISLGSVTGGTVGVDRTSAVYGQTVTVTAIPETGYMLKHILVDGEAIDGNTFAVTGDHVVAAVFEKIVAKKTFGYFSLEVVNTIIVNGEEVDICRWVWTPVER